MKLARLSLIPALVILQGACQFPIGTLPKSTKVGSTNSFQQQTRSKNPHTGPEYEAYLSEVRKHWSNSNYDWLEDQAKRLRESKERLPGGYWKLRVLYLSIETLVDSDAPDEEWNEHISHLTEWAKERPTSVMPRIILADVWRSYGWKARGHEMANQVKPENWKPFEERHKKASEILAEAAKLGEKCPEWYLTALLVARAEGANRQAFEELYEQSITFEPEYYYLYQAKAGYLLPQWYGRPGDWELFAEAAANRVGGEQGDIILFAIYSYMMANRNADFMETHRAIAPRLISGFRAIEKLYGTSPQRLNEACLISFFADDNKTPAELMKRIGTEYDVTVWKDESVFNIFRQEALMRIGELPRYRK
jgi:hypothetical protein